MVDTNFFYGPIYSIRTLMANSATFRTLVGAGTVDAAKAFIYPFQAYDEDYDDDNTTQSRPRVLLSYEACASAKKGVSHWTSGYSVVADFEFLPTDDDDQVAAAAMLSTVQTIVSEMLVLEGTSGHVIVNQVHAADCVEISDPDEEEGGEKFLWYGVKFIRELE